MAALLLLWTALLVGRSLQVSLTVSPDQSQFSQGSQLLIRCSDVGFSVWRQSRGTRGRCNEDWGMLSGPYCRVPLLHVKDTGQYWCESPEGAASEPIDITVIDRGVVLQAPVHPVAPRKSVSLTCRHLTDSALTARFYKDGRHLPDPPARVLTLQRVAASDEGQYECEIKGERSVAVRLRVLPEKTPPSTTPTPPTATATSRPGSTGAPSLLRLVVPVVASVVGLVLLLLLVLVVLVVRRCRRKKNKGPRGKRRRGTRPRTEAPSGTRPRTEAPSGNSRNQRRPRTCPNCQNSGAPLQPLCP